jgi:hypothetical protein
MGKTIYLTPEYLTENNLWDSIWLEEKYPDYFINKNK